MNIVVNTRLLLKNKLEGIGWFSYESLKRITKAHPEHQFVFLFDRPYDEEFIFSDNITPVVVSPQARHPFLYYLWFEYAVPKQLRRFKADLFLSPDGYLSLSAKVKSLPVIHDLNFEHFPEYLPYLQRAYYRHFFPLFARKASRIATVSEFSKKDIVELYGIHPDKIDVVYNGANDTFLPISESEKQEIKNTFAEGKDFFVFIGALHPRKNLVNLFRAFDLFCENNVQDLRLIIIGNKKYWTDDIRGAYEKMKFSERVIFTGRMLTENLHKVLASAIALTYVPFFEGFGIPIVEAMYCETPVITSDCTSMPEISGDAAMIVNPHSPDAIARAMRKLYVDKQYRQSLIEKGRERRKRYTWQKTAANLWLCVEKTLNS